MRRRALDVGVTGFHLSNHGGRQLDRCTPTIDMLAPLRAGVGPDVPIVIDSGVRHGADIAVSIALGADMAFIGRPYVYAVAAAGQRGVEHVITTADRSAAIGDAAQWCHDARRVAQARAGVAQRPGCSVNVETGETGRGEATWSGRLAHLSRFGTGLYVAEQRDRSLAITFEGDQLEHHLSTVLSLRRAKCSRSRRDDPGGETSVWRLALLRDEHQIGDPLALAINNIIRVELIDDTSALTVADGRISVHDFATGVDREIANLPEAWDVWITSPDRIWIARDEQPTLLIDGEGNTVAEFPAGMYPIAARVGCSLITRWNVQEASLVDNSSGRTIITFGLTPEDFYGADDCTTWSDGIKATLVIDGRVVDLGFAAYVVDLSANGHQAIVFGNNGPVLLDTVTRNQTPLPDGEYRFAEL